MASACATPSTSLLPSSSRAPSCSQNRLTQSSSFRGSQLKVEFPREASVRSYRLVVNAKGKRSQVPGGGRPMPQEPMLPTFDPNDDTPKFVLFIRSKAVELWYPLSVVSGGTAAKMMVSVMESEFGKKLYQGTLTRNIGSVIYKDEKAVRELALKQFPVLKSASKLQYGYKLVDRNNPRASFMGSNVIVIPPEKELKTVLDKAKDFFDNQVKNITGQVKNVGIPDAKN